MAMQTDLAKFIRRRDYRIEKELGQGACGITVLLHDEQIDERFVCKKFTPYSESSRQSLFLKFVAETKILHQLHHENIVRVFNYYLYPDLATGYILMEYVQGAHIDDFLNARPELINELFLAAVGAFSYLQDKEILHRDIRPQNLMVSDNGILKIIDFGFGKRVSQPEDFDKSVTLNWWCEPPAEFAEGKYDFATEVYFVGKLFDRIIRENELDQFKYPTLLTKMCERSPSRRSAGFAEILQAIQADKFLEVGFDDDELWAYREFSDALGEHITRIEQSAKYVDDISRVQSDLEAAYRSCMLEEKIPDCNIVAKCIVRGEYYRKPKGFGVATLRAFVHTLKGLSPEKKRIFLANLHTRLDSIPRYDKPAFGNEDIPF